MNRGKNRSKRFSKMKKNTLMRDRYEIKEGKTVKLDDKMKTIKEN